MQRARHVLALHDLLDREDGRDVERDTGVMALAMARRAVNERRVGRGAGALGGLWYAIDIGADRDDRLAVPPGGKPRGGDAGDAALDGEAFLFENAGQVFGSFEFLETQLAEAEDLVDHDLGLLGAGVDIAQEVGGEGGLFLGLESGGKEEQERENWGAHRVWNRIAHGEQRWHRAS